MTNINNATFLDYAGFLKGSGQVGHEDVDRACLSREHFENIKCLKSLLPLYFFLTREKEKKMTVAEMKKTFGCGAELIRKVREAINEKKPLPVPGRKKEKPVRSDRALINLVDTMTREDGSLSSGALANILGSSESSINRIRQDLGYSYKPLRNGPRLLQRHFAPRLTFCLNHQNDDWSKTLFTDESRFSTSPDCPVMWWTKKGDNIYAEKEKFPFSIMVWAGIIGATKTPLIKCPKILDAPAYVAMLEQHGIIEFLMRVDNNAIFQQDGAPCHRATSTRLWFESHNVRLLEKWPANSPDLSPIEQIWGIAKRYIIERFGMRTSLENAKLEDAVFDAYDRIKPETIAVLTLSVKHRVQLCVARRGGFVGDALDECCRRAKVEFEASTTLQLVSITPAMMQQSRMATGDDADDGESGNLTRLSSFRSHQ